MLMGDRGSYGLRTTTSPDSASAPVKATSARIAAGFGTGAGDERGDWFGDVPGCWTCG